MANFTSTRRDLLAALAGVVGYILGLGPSRSAVMQEWRLR
jgi:hypothetical protein